MAHTCPHCGQYCTCRGDWDDCDMGEDPECEHCPEGFDGDDDEDSPAWDQEEEEYEL